MQSIKSFFYGSIIAIFSYLFGHVSAQNDIIERGYHDTVVDVCKDADKPIECLTTAL